MKAQTETLITNGYQSISKREIVVCGATGTQGSSVVESLMDQHEDYKIVALSRNMNSEKAKKLKAQGVEVREADLEDKASLIQAFKGAYGAFAVTQPWSADNKHCFPKKEVEQGKNIIEACLVNNVHHMVYSSVLNFTSKKINVPHVDSKLEIEQMLKSTSLNYTIIRLPQFMDNLGSSFFPVKKGVIKGFVDSDAKVPYICSKDIGKFVRHAFNNPSQFKNQEISVIGDMVSGEELSQLMSYVRKNEKFKYKSVPKILLKIFAKEFYTMRIFFETYGRSPLIDVPTEIHKKTHNMQPDLISMRQFLIMKKFDTMVLT
jgi:uncharacterized protein YbjT (DUF2867 family)